MFVCLSVTVDQLLVLAMVDDALHGSDLLEWHCHFVTKTAAKKMHLTLIWDLPQHVEHLEHSKDGT
jgi:hypothetical protein